MELFMATEDWHTTYRAALAAHNQEAIADQVLELIGEALQRYQQTPADVHPRPAKVVLEEMRPKVLAWVRGPHGHQ